LLEYIGIEPERIQFSWISAGEGERFADIITKITEDVKKIGPASRLVKGEKK
jgi:F420-non-reducing hydrogenase iron-sulfur subunit